MSQAQKDSDAAMKALRDLKIHGILSRFDNVMSPAFCRGDVGLAFRQARDEINLLVEEEIRKALVESHPLSSLKPLILGVFKEGERLTHIEIHEKLGRQFLLRDIQRSVMALIDDGKVSIGLDWRISVI